MASKRTKTLVGLAMIALGLVQVGSYAVTGDWILSVLGSVYACLGMAFLWAEVYSSWQ